MSEPRKNHLSIDGGQVKEDDHVASYKPIPEADTEFRTSKSSLGKSKEKVSDGAEEKLLSKEDEAKIVRVDMADAKYVVGDHRNGDAKIELDANKRQFSGLTKEELMKYADDPFWVNLRWCLFVLFWTMWLAMLAGAITIIVRAPKCAQPSPRAWYDNYPLLESEGESYSELEEMLPAMKSSLVKGVFLKVPTYDATEDDILAFKTFVAKAKASDVKVIVELTPNYVSLSNEWFEKSVNRSDPYTDYFIWANSTEFDAAGERKPPNNWVSTYNTSAWTYNKDRKQFYLHQYEDVQPDLNFDNSRVVAELVNVITQWTNAGAHGVRLNNGRQLLVDRLLPNEVEAPNVGGPVDVHTTYPYWSHRATSDQPELNTLLNRFKEAVVQFDSENVFTMKEDGSRAELFLSTNMSSLQPPSAKVVTVFNVTVAAKELNKRLAVRWPLLQLKSEPDAEGELALFAMLLPATPVLSARQIQRDNDTTLSKVVALRLDASLQHGNHSIVGVPAGAEPLHRLLACARWKSGHTGYIAVFNPEAGALRANLTAVPTVPASLSVHDVSPTVHSHTNYTKNLVEQADNILVPGWSTVVLSYVPHTAAES